MSAAPTTSPTTMQSAAEAFGAISGLVFDLSKAQGTARAPPLSAVVRGDYKCDEYKESQKYKEDMLASVFRAQLTDQMQSQCGYSATEAAQGVTVADSATGGTRTDLYLPGQDVDPTAFTRDLEQTCKKRLICQAANGDVVYSPGDLTSFAAEQLERMVDDDALKNAKATFIKAHVDMPTEELESIYKRLDLSFHPSDVTRVEAELVADVDKETRKAEDRRQNNPTAEDYYDPDKPRPGFSERERAKLTQLRAQFVRRTQENTAATRQRFSEALANQISDTTGGPEPDISHVFMTNASKGNFPFDTNPSDTYVSYYTPATSVEFPTVLLRKPQSVSSAPTGIRSGARSSSDAAGTIGLRSHMT
ncbi:hypothetical protein IAT40_007323 [Kwoniella sp. CBS 6097]